jgi:hypothetical protein
LRNQFGVYHVVDDESLSTNELIQLIAISQNKQALILPISKRFIGGFAKNRRVFAIAHQLRTLSKVDGKLCGG